MFVWNKFCVVLSLGFLSLFSVSLGAEHRHCALVAGTLVEVYHAVCQSIQRIILALSNVLTSEMLVATLTDDDVAGDNLLSTPNLNT